MQFEFKAIEHERRRVAKELHDDILPSMARLTRTVQSQDFDESRSELIEEMHKTIGVFRDLLGELHPVDLEMFGLVPALSNMCSRYARLTGLCVFLVERTEEFFLSELEQLCLYRAIQAALGMFAESDNDILLITCDRNEEANIITVRCVDKRVSSADWISIEKSEFNAFEAWCAKAGANVEIGTGRCKDFPLDLIISVPLSILEPNLEQKLELDLELELSLELEMRPRNEPNANPKSELEANAELLIETLAIEIERKRIGEDMNRLIVPRFANLLRIASESASEDLLADFDERLNIISDCMRGIMVGLHPPILAEAGLVSSIRTLVDFFRRSSQIETALVCDLLFDQFDVSLEAKFAIYRVTQEALNNIEKHSGASQAQVCLKQMGGYLVVYIEDNGKGFEERRSTQSRGLKNIRERASAIGATVAWEQSLTFRTGTLVTISLSCKPAMLAVVSS